MRSVDAASKFCLNSITLQSKMQETQKNIEGREQLALLFSDAVDSSKGSMEPTGSQRVECKVHFCSERHEKAFQTLTERQKQYIAAYIKTGSPTAVLKELGLSGSVKQVSKRIAEISRLMGCTDVRQLRPQESNDRATALGLKQIVEQQNYQCALTGRHLTPKNAELDHVVPRSKGGTNERENLQWLHKQVNRAKGTMTQSEFVAMCQEVSDYSRRKINRGSLPASGN